MTTQAYAIHELVDFAVEIEKQGAAFYQAMAQQTQSIQAKEVYLLLHNEELAHQRKYQRMLEEVKQTTAPDIVYSDDYYQYLRAIVEKVIFDPSVAVKESSLQSDTEVIDFALGKERDSILYYMEMKKQISQKQHALVDSIIAEEQLHIIKLLDIREHVE
jgi:rubrerythrin